MKGYLVIAQNSGEHDYIRMAYALALSIKNTQSEVNQFAIAVDNVDDVSDEYKKVFDHIIEIPWEDDAKDTAWKINNKWKYFYMTPFEETVVLDTDMIFTHDISYWWDILSTKDMWFTTQPRTYKNQTITSDAYRKVFTSNNLPNLYTAFMYFKKSKLASEVFSMTHDIFEDWENFYYNFLEEDRPKQLSGDVAYALAVKILDVEQDVTDNLDMPCFIHMKSKVQNIKTAIVTEDWTNHVPSYFTSDCKLKINTFEQILPFHYHIKSWLTNDIILKLEKQHDIG